MTSTNRTAIGFVRESTIGVTPGSPRVRTARFTGESLTYGPEFIDTDEIRSDRMLPDPILSMRAAGGGVNFEVSYPQNDTWLSEVVRSAMLNAWVNTPERDNDGVADSVITDIGTVANTVTVTTGAAFVVGHLLRNTGFTNAANNGLFPVTTGGTTSAVSTGAGWVAEAAPPATARVKVVGIQGVSGDITATASGLSATTMNFVNAGIVVGMWLKIGGTGAAFRFATAANNGWARVTAVTATTVTLDNLPAGWSTDTGTGKTIRVFFGDRIQNGVTISSMTIEKGFLGQTVPTYLTYVGMVVGQMTWTIGSRAKVTGSATFTGMGGTNSTTSVDTPYDAATTGAVFAGNANVGRVAEAGATLTSPNWARSFEFTINNNLRTIEAVDSTSPVAVREGECTVTGRIETYFGDNSLLTKFQAGTPTTLSSRLEKNSQAIVVTIPRAVYRSDGNPQAGGKNADVMLPLGFQAAIDTATNSHVYMDRLEYFEP